MLRTFKLEGDEGQIGYGKESENVENVEKQKPARQCVLLRHRHLEYSQQAYEEIYLIFLLQRQ